MMFTNIKIIQMKQHSTFINGRVVKYSMAIISIFLLLIVGIISPEQAHAQLGVVASQTPDGGMAIDGNLLARTPDSSPFSADDGDFLPNDNAPGNGGAVFSITGVPFDTATAFHVIDGYDDADMNIFTSGSKFNHDPNTWTWKEGKPPAKDDMNHILFVFSSDSMENIWFVGAGDRKKVNGNTYLDFELLQNPLYVEEDGSFNSMGPDGGRTNGDLAITVEYTNGGINPDLYIYRWEDVGQGGFDYVPITPENGTTYFTINQDSSIIVPYGAYGSTSYPKYAFTEVAVNINEVVPGMYACLDIKSVIVKTKASQSLNAMLKDVIDPVAVDISSAPVVTIEDTTICFGETATLTATIHSGTGPYTFNWSTGDTTQSIVVSPDTTTTYWAIVTGVNGCPSDTVYATVTVLPLPVCYITGPDTLCPLGTAQYFAPDTMISYTWTLNGPGIILGDTSLQMIDVQGIGSCDSSFVLELTITGSNGCSNTCMQIVSLFDTLPPQFTYVPDSLWLECAAEVPPASIDSVTVEDNCYGNIIVTVADTIVNDSCANQFNIIRTWTATDTCGNSSTASQYIMVFDSIAPVFTYVPDSLWLECASGVLPASIDSVTVEDNCYGNVIVTVADSITNDSCANQFNIIRTWSATDTCGNTSFASQYIMIFDSTAPIFTYVPDSLWLECASEITAASIDSVVVEDNCYGNIIVTVADSIVNDLCANQFDIIRTWTATDTCGNSSTASQYIMVFDSIVPVFTYVPDSLWLECASEVPAASVDSVMVTDNCTSNLILTVSDSILNDFCLNQYNILRTWTATDTCGNSSTTSQFIMIYDSIPPQLYGVPADTGVCCVDSIPLPATVTAYDSCDGDLTVTLTEIVSDSTGPLYFTLTRIWMASDLCDNIVVDSMVIEVNDTLYQTWGMVDIDESNKIALYFRIAPNPFKQGTNITFSPAMDGYVDLDLYNYFGIKQRSLYSGYLKAGSEVKIPLQGNSLTQGMYLLTLKTRYGIETRRILLKR